MEIDSFSSCFFIYLIYNHFYLFLSQTTSKKYKFEAYESKKNYRIQSTLR
jgi:hypothetical protein